MTAEDATAQRFDWSHWIEEYASDPPSVLAAAEAARRRGAITKEELLRIAYWKSPRAVRKMADALGAERSPDEKVCELAAPDSEGEDEALLNNLMQVRGVATSVASAVLALVYPERFAVTDWRARDELNRLYPEQYKADDTTENYLEQYLPRIRAIAASHGITPREADKALWARSRARYVEELVRS